MTRFSSLQLLGRSPDVSQCSRQSRRDQADLLTKPAPTLLLLELESAVRPAGPAERRLNLRPFLPAADFRPELSAEAARLVEHLAEQDRSIGRTEYGRAMGRDGVDELKRRSELREPCVDGRLDREVAGLDELKDRNLKRGRRPQEKGGRR